MGLEVVAAVSLSTHQIINFASTNVFNLAFWNTALRPTVPFLIWNIFFLIFSFWHVPISTLVAISSIPWELLPGCHRADKHSRKPRTWCFHKAFIFVENSIQALHCHSQSIGEHANIKNGEVCSNLLVSISFFGSYFPFAVLGLVCFVIYVAWQ